jgi:hypothetical protein
MLVPVLLCTFYTTCFGHDQWPSSGDLLYKIYVKAVTNISTDPLSQIYKRANAVVKVSLEHVVVQNAKIFKSVINTVLKELNTINL